MRGDDGETLGRWSLRLDAAYCLAVGAAVAAFAPLIAQNVALPTPLFVVAGVVVIVWAGLILAMLSRLPLRTALRAVLAVNVVAAAAVAAASVTAATALAVIAVLAVAVDVALFAVSQVAALRTLRPA